MSYRTTIRLDDASVADGDRGFRGVNLRLQTNQLQPGDVRESLNGRIEGFWRPRKGVVSRVGSLTSSTTGLNLPFHLIDTPKVIAAVSYAAGVVTITIVGHGIGVGAVGYASVTGINYTGTDNNGTKVVTYATANTLTFPVTGVSAVTLGATPRLGQVAISDVVETEVLASCLFSDPNSDDAESIIVAFSTGAKKVDLGNFGVTSLSYPGGQTVAGATDMIQCFGKVLLFREGQPALQWDGVSGAFTTCPGGAFAQPVVMDGASNVSVVDGVATMTHVAHGYSAGDTIEVLRAMVGVGPVEGDRYVVATVPGANSLTFYCNWADGTYTVVMSGPQSLGGGFMHQPGAGWGTYFQRRLWVPFGYTQSGAAPGTFTARGVSDEIAASDILDDSTFDQVYNQFRISGGTADKVVAMHGFFLDSLIVFMRNSIHMISGTQGSLDDTSVRELTREVGCLARRSVVTRGNRVLFLSDSGVFALEFQDQYNLRGADEPLSKPIQPYIDRINKNLADKSCAIFYDNRYFLAIPLDSTVGANDAKGNNAVLVYNFLNEAWESLDTYGSSGFLITNFIAASAGVRNDLYSVTPNGGLHQMEVLDTPNDRLSVTTTSTDVVIAPISARLTTRGYDCGEFDRKRFTEAQVQMQTMAGEVAEMSVAFSSEDPDNAVALGTTTKFLGGTALTPSTSTEAETGNIRFRLGGQRGFTGTLIFTRTQGNPKIHSVKVMGTITNRATISQK